MRFALIDNVRTSPLPGLTAACPVCGATVIAKCGRQRIHHWAHRAERDCDPWWEPETEWHREWKAKFPEPRWEVILRAETGEIHRSDVRTKHGLTIEFQRSPITPEERESREKFYGNMVWVVDGSRLVRDLPRFVEGSQSFRGVAPGVYITPFPNEAFPKSWLNCAAPVFFDFANAPGLTDHNAYVANALWCLLPIALMAEPWCFAYHETILLNRHTSERGWYRQRRR